MSDNVVTPVCKVASIKELSTLQQLLMHASEAGYIEQMQVKGEQETYRNWHMIAGI